MRSGCGTDRQATNPVVGQDLAHATAGDVDRIQRTPTRDNDPPVAIDPAHCRRPLAGDALEEMRDHRGLQRDDEQPARIEVQRQPATIIGQDRRAASARSLVDELVVATVEPHASQGAAIHTPEAERAQARLVHDPLTVGGRCRVPRHPRRHAAQAMPRSDQPVTAAREGAAADPYQARGAAGNHLRNAHSLSRGRIDARRDRGGTRRPEHEGERKAGDCQGHAAIQPDAAQVGARDEQRERGREERQDGHRQEPDEKGLDAAKRPRGMGERHAECEAAVLDGHRNGEPAQHSEKRLPRQQRAQRGAGEHEQHECERQDLQRRAGQARRHGVRRERKRQRLREAAEVDELRHAEREADNCQQRDRCRRGLHPPHPRTRHRPR